MSEGSFSFSAVMGEENLSTGGSCVLFLYIYIIYTCMSRYKYTKPGMLRGGKEKGEGREGQDIAAAVLVRSFG